MPQLYFFLLSFAHGMFIIVFIGSESDMYLRPMFSINRF